MKAPKLLTALLVVALLLQAQPASAEPDPYIKAYGEGCLTCFNNYVKRLNKTLTEDGLTLRVTFIDGNPAAQQELQDLLTELGVPPEYTGKAAVFVNNNTVFLNYAPVGVIKEYAANHSDETRYKFARWNLMQQSWQVMIDRDIIECRINASLTECTYTGELPSSGNPLPIVLTSGLIDGINPCAFTVFLFFITVIYSTKSLGESARRETLKVGLTYITAVYLGYLAIGLVLHGTIARIGHPAIIARLAAFLLIAMGALDVRDSLSTGKPLLSLGEGQWNTLRTMFRKATIPASFAAGLLVSFFEFPCTGGIYLSIIGLLVSTTRKTEGLLYLVLYNAMFVAPLLVLLGASLALEGREFSLAKWGMHEKRLRLMTGVAFIAVGIYMLLV